MIPEKKEPNTPGVKGPILDRSNIQKKCVETDFKEWYLTTTQNNASLTNQLKTF